MNAPVRSKPIIFSSEPIEHFRKNRTEHFPCEWELLNGMRRLNDEFQEEFGSRFQLQFHPEDGYVRVVSALGTLIVAAADEIDDPHQVQMDLTYIAMLVLFGCVKERDPKDLQQGSRLLVFSQIGKNDGEE